MEFIEKEKLLELREMSYLLACDLKLVVETDIDTVAFYMGYTNDSSDLMYFDDVLSKQGIDLELIRNKHQTKLMVHVPSGYHISNGLISRIENDKGDSPVTDANDIRRLITLRVSIIFSFAVAGILPGSRVAGYRRRQQPADRKFWVEHNEVYGLLHKYMTPNTFTGNYEEDIRMVFQLLWLCFPHDITGFDDRLKQLTLEGNFFKKNRKERSNYEIIQKKYSK